MTESEAAAVAAIRRFGRFHTRWIGALGGNLHDSGFALTEARVLYELAQRDGCLAVELAPLVDGFITDTYSPETGASGATGRTHDWAVSRRLVQLSPKPVILAGGLTPANVRQAIAAVRPAGVDVHTGVEDASGRKDRDKVLAFVAEAKAGFRA